MGFRKFFEILLGFDTPPPPPTEMQRWQDILVDGAHKRHLKQYDAALLVFEGVLAEARQAGDRVAEATALGHIGATYTDQARWEEADNALNTAVAIAREQHNPMLLAAVLNDRSQSLLARGDASAARQSFEEALSYARQSTDPRLTAHILAGLADLYLADNNASYARRLLEEANQLTQYQLPAVLGRLGEAEIAAGREAEGHRWIVQALRLSHATGDNEQEIRWATALSRRYVQEGKLHEANRLYQRVALLAAQSPAATGDDQVRHLLDRAVVSQQLGQHQDAIRYATESLAMAERLSLADEVARAHGLLGTVYRLTGQRELAVEHLQKALGTIPAGASAGQANDLRLELAMTQQEAEPDAAASIYREVAASARQAGDKATVARTLTNLGRLEHARNRDQAALESWREAAALYEGLGDHRHRVALLCDIANLLKERGDQKQALGLYEQALIGLNHVNHAPTRGLVLSNVANMYTDTGDVETAKAFFDESIKIAHESGDRTAESVRLGNLGWFYVVTGQEQQAVASLEQALSLSNQMDAPLVQAVQRNNLAMACARLAQFDRAVELHQQALDLVAGKHQPRWEAWFHSDLGETLSRQRLFEQARPHYLKALELCDAAGYEPARARTLWRMADLQREIGDLEAAGSTYVRAVQQAQSIGSQRDLAHALLGQGLLAAIEQRAEQARQQLSEARRLLTILHAPERQQAEEALRQMA